MPKQDEKNDTVIFDEDIIWESIALERDTGSARYISHDEAWEHFDG